MQWVCNEHARGVQGACNPQRPAEAHGSLSSSAWGSLQRWEPSCNGPAMGSRVPPPRLFLQQQPCLQGWTHHPPPWTHHSQPGIAPAEGLSLPPPEPYQPVKTPIPPQSPLLTSPTPHSLRPPAREAGGRHLGTGSDARDVTKRRGRGMLIRGRAPPPSQPHVLVLILCKEGERDGAPLNPCFPTRQCMGGNGDSGGRDLI